MCKKFKLFLNRMLEFLRSITNKHQTTIPLEFSQDLNWFLQFLKDFNGTTFFDNKSYDASVELDACPTGLGGRWGEVVYTVPIQASDAMLNIAHTEMLNVLVALRLWRNQWFNKKIQICCDNQASVEVLNSGRTRDRTLAAIARNIQLIAALSEIEIKVVHIPGKNNCVADLLSRWDNTHANYNKLQQILPAHRWIFVPHHYLDINWSI